MRSYRFDHSSDDPGLIDDPGVTDPSSITYFLGTDGPTFQTGPGTGVDSAGKVNGFLNLHVNEALEFELDFSLSLNNAVRKQSYVVRPNTTTPFLISVRASGDEESNELADTAAALQGVITAGHRFSVTDIVGRSVSDVLDVVGKRGTAAAKKGPARRK